MLSSTLQRCNVKSVVRSSFDAMMGAMIRVALTSFVALCLLIAPVAHAAGVDCKAPEAVKIESTKVFAKKDSVSNERHGNKQQGKHQSGKLDHHCCNYFTAKLEVAFTGHSLVSTKVLFPFENDAIGSLVLGPPLKPPSHA